MGLIAKNAMAAKATDELGKVIETSDRHSFVFSVTSASPPSHRDFVEVAFQKQGRDFVLIGQVELIVGRGVTVGQKTSTSNLSILGMGAEVVATVNVEETQFRATARVIAFIDDSGRVTSHDPTVEYMSHSVKDARPDNLRRVFSEIGDPDLVPLQIGSLIGCSECVPVAFDPSGLMRHTAIFGQSGSGKSFSFGILLEELLQRTDARILVMDPNSDYSSFSRIRTRNAIASHCLRTFTTDQHAEFAQNWEEVLKQSFQFGADNSDLTKPRKIAFGDLNRREQASLLGLDPINDREEYSVFREVLDSFTNSSFDIDAFVAKLTDSPSVEKIRLLYRIKNNEIDRLSLWGRPSIVETLRSSDWRFASIDLRSASPLERSLISSAVLEALYKETIESRRVTFIVIDEAHNLCPAVSSYDHQESPKRIIHEIAAEGRKYGAFLMLLTQNPSKLSEQALLQCDNVILMRMTSDVEVEALSKIVAGASPTLAQTAFSLGKGEAICMGGIVRTPTIAKFDLRKTQPGGDDISKEWARRSLGT